MSSLSQTQTELESYLMEELGTCINIKDYSLQNNTALRLRGRLIEWIYMLNTKLAGHIPTLFHSINLFDRYMSKVIKPVKEEKIFLLAGVCFIIAFKFKEVVCFDLELFICQILKNKFTLVKIRKTEFKILKLINFRVLSPELQTLSETVLTIIKNKFSENKVSLSENKIEKLFIFINIISLFVEEFLFNFSKKKLLVVNLLTIYKLVEKKRILLYREKKFLKFVIYELVDKLTIELDLIELNEMSNLLYEAMMFHSQNKNKFIFYELYCELVKES